MRPSGSKPLNHTEIGLLFMTDHVLNVALNEEPKPWPFSLRAFWAANFSVWNYLIAVFLVGAFSLLGIGSFVSNWFEGIVIFRVLDNEVPIDLGRVAGVLAFAVALYVLISVRHAWYERQALYRWFGQ